MLPLFILAALILAIPIDFDIVACRIENISKIDISMRFGPFKTNLPNKARRQKVDKSQRSAEASDKGHIPKFLLDFDVLETLARLIVNVIKSISVKMKECRIKFGFEDPSITGMIYGYFMAVFGLTGLKAEIEPVYEEEVLEASLKIKVRFQLYRMLWPIVRAALSSHDRKVMIKIIKATWN